MARTFSNVKVIISALVADGLSNSVARRGYAAAAQSATRAMSGKVTASKSGENKAAGGDGDKVSWVPDPVTGYYKPEKNTNEIIDVAELRAMALAKK